MYVFGIHINFKIVENQSSQTPKGKTRKTKKDDDESSQNFTFWSYLIDRNTCTSFHPEYNLLHAILLDYYLSFICWCHESWLKIIFFNKTDDETGVYERLINNNNSEELKKQQESNNETIICYLALIITLAHGLLEYLQLQQFAEKDAKQRLYNCLKLFKQMLIEIEQDETVTLTQDFIQMDTSSQQLHFSEKRLTGILSNLPTEHAKMLVDFVMRYFFGHFKLLESIFGPDSAIERDKEIKTINLPLELLPKSSKIVDEPWPRPFSESIPIDLINRFEDRFDPKLVEKLNREGLLQNENYLLKLDQNFCDSPKENMDEKEEDLPTDFLPTNFNPNSRKDSVPNYIEHLIARIKQIPHESLAQMNDISDENIDQILSDIIFEFRCDAQKEDNEKFSELKSELIKCFRETIQILLSERN